MMSIFATAFSDFIWPFLPPYKGVIPNPKVAFISPISCILALIIPISCILALIFPIFMKYFPKCSVKGKSLALNLYM